jgi:hypothetical protein
MGLPLITQYFFLPFTDGMVIFTPRNAFLDSSFSHSSLEPFLAPISRHFRPNISLLAKPAAVTKMI